MKKLRKQLKGIFKEEGIGYHQFLEIELRLWLLNQSKNEWLVADGYKMFDDNYQVLAPMVESEKWYNYRFILKSKYRALVKKNRWAKAMQYYFKEVPNRFRLYELNQECGLITHQPAYFPERIAIFKQYLEEIDLEKKKNITLEEKELYYYVFNEREQLHFELPEDLPDNDCFELLGYRSKKRMNLNFDYGPLFQQIGNGFEKRPRIELTPLILSGKSCRELAGLKHIIGGLGAGKSNFKLATVYEAVKIKEMKCGIIETDVNGVLETVKWLASNGIKAVPLVGLTTQDKHLLNLCRKNTHSATNQIDFKSLLDHPAFSYLSGTCPLLEACEAVIGNSMICSHVLDREGNRCACSMGLVCGKYRMYRELNEADVIVTTPHNLVKGGIPSIFDRYDRSIYEYFYDTLDLIMIDEIDEVQSTLDEQFIERISLNQGHENLRNQLEVYKKELIDNNLADKVTSAHRFVQGVLKFEIIFTNFQYLLSNNQRLKYFLKQGTFNTFALSQEIIKSLENDGNSLFCEKLETFIQIDEDLNHEWFEVIESSYEKIENPMTEWMQFVEKLLNEYKVTLSSRKDERLFQEKVIFLIALKTLEVIISILKNEYDNVVEDLGEEWNTIQSLSTTTLKISKWADAPVLKTLDGFYITHQENYQVEILSYRGIGRTLVSKWSTLKPQKEGPSVVILSGTSVAPGSAHYHLQHAPDYLLTSHIPEGNIEVCYTPAYWYNEKSKKQELLCLSGSMEDDRIEILQKMTRYMKYLIRQEIASNNKIIVVVNRYTDCECIAKVLKEDGFSYAYVGNQETNNPACITKDQLESFETITNGADICIVPLSIIARGYNILNQEGNSYFQTMFCMIRPYLIPGDIDSYIKMLHYYQPILLEEVKTLGYSVTERQNALMKLNYAKFHDIVRMSYWNKLNEEQKKIVGWYMFIPIKQAIGRMQRNGTNCKVYFVDGSFCKAIDKKEVQSIENSMFKMWEKMIHDELDDPVIQKLYGSIHKSLEQMIQQIDSKILEEEYE